MKTHPRTLQRPLGIVAILLCAATVHGAPVNQVVNGEFESPNIGTFGTPNNAAMAPWVTDAGNGLFEVWGQNFLSSPTNGSDGSPTGQHLELSESQVNVWNRQVVTIPNFARADVSWDWWQRSGGENITWQISGSQSGILYSGTTTGSTSAWTKLSSSILSVKPGEQVTLQFQSNVNAHIDQVVFGTYRPVPGRQILIDERFNGATLPTSGPVQWSDTDAGPTTFELYTAGAGAAARAMQNTYDHDNDVGTAQVNIIGASEVNDAGGPLTLTAQLTLPLSIDPDGVNGQISFFAGTRSAAGVLPTLQIYNVTDNRNILATTNIALNSDRSVWNFNSFDVDFIAADLGDVIQVRFFGGGTGGADGLQLTDMVFAVPEPGTGILSAIAVAAVVGLRRRRKA